MSRNSILLLFITGINLVFSKHNHFYRKDYTYKEEYDAYYKLHWDSSGWSWNSAFMACDSEGAKLFYPTGEEWTLVKNLTNSMVTPPNTTEIFVGLHNEFGLGEFITVDGKPTEKPLNIAIEDVTFSEGSSSCMVMDYTTGQFRMTQCYGNPGEIIPFLCKKMDSESCPTIDHDYHYVKYARKCFKVNKRQRTWQAAMQTCYMEGGILADLEDTSILSEKYLFEGQQDNSYFIGFKKSFATNSFYTVKGKKYENYKFNEWYEEERHPNKNCGVLKSYSYNGESKIQVESCESEYPFICEMVANN